MKKSKGKRMAIGGSASVGSGKRVKGGVSVPRKFANAKPMEKGRRMAVGGPVGYGGTNTNDPVGRGGAGGTGLGGVSGGIRGGGSGRGGPAGGVTTGTLTGTSATNRPMSRPMQGRPVARPAAVPVMKKVARPAMPPSGVPMPREGIMFGNGSLWPGQGSRPMDRGYNPPDVPDEALPAPSGMRGGGLARKGKGQALSRGGKVKKSKSR